VDKGSRQFRVTKVTYSAGLADQADRRSQSVTTTAGSGTLTKVGTFSSDLINLNDPVDVNKFPGYNKGHFTVTVEAKVVEGGKVSTATLTREYEVVPRCCGASFGSNASGGASLNNSSSLGRAALLRQHLEAAVEPRPTSMAQRFQALRSLLRPSRCPRSAVNR